MGQLSLERLAPLAGIGFAVLLLIGRLLVWTYPDADAPAGEAVSFWSGKDDKLIAVSIVGSLSAVLFVFFGATVAGAVRRLEDRGGWLGSLCLGGAVLTSAAILVEESLVFTTAESAGKVPDEVTQTMSALQADFFLPFIGGFVVFFIAVAAGVLRTGALPRWVGWSALVIALLWLLPNPAVIFLTWIWVIAVSALLFLREESVAGRTTEIPAG